MKKEWVLVGALVVLGLAAMIFGMSISCNNQDARLRNAILAKESAREAVFDETWKDIKQIAEVSEKYAADFKQIYPEIMAGRYGNARGGALLSFVTEANPKFSTKLYEKLANVIESKRAEFTNVQKQLIDVKREHDNLLDTFPGTVFVSNRVKVEVKIISSARTKNVIESGEDNDVTVF